MKVQLGFDRGATFDAPPDLERVFRSAFPGYKGRKFRVFVRTHECCSDTYWDGGSRSQYVFVNLATGERLHLPDLISGGYAPHAAEASRMLGTVNIRPGLAIVRHAIVQGKDIGLSITIHPDNVPPSLVAPQVQQ